MKEPPYVSSLRITLSELAVKDSALESRLKAQPGVAEAIVVPEERSAYVRWIPSRPIAVSWKRWSIRCKESGPAMPARKLIAEVLELERLPQIAAAHQRHHALQIVA